MITGTELWVGTILTCQELWQSADQGPVEDDLFEILFRHIVGDPTFEDHLTDPAKWQTFLGTQEIGMVPHDLVDEYGGDMIIGIKIEPGTVLDLLRQVKEHGIDPQSEIICLPNDCHCCT